MNSERKEANTQCSGFAKQNFETHVLTRVFQGAVQKSTIFELLNPFFHYKDKPTYLQPALDLFSFGLELWK